MKNTKTIYLLIKVELSSDEEITDENIDTFSEGMDYSVTAPEDSTLKVTDTEVSETFNEYPFS